MRRFRFEWPGSSLFLILIFISFVLSEDYNILQNDGSYEFGYDNPDSFHHSQANRQNFVRGEFGGRNPKTGAIDVVQYTAGPRGYRPRGKNIARKFDQNQSGPRPVGNRDDPYFDPNEDPSYNFGFKTRTYQRKESANRIGDVNGQYSYLDDVGERHNVEFIAGKRTGFHVKTPFPDSNPRAYGPLFFNGRGKPIPRGRTSIQRGTDGSYRFVSAGPDQRRTETSDANGNVRGSYTYLDDKGVQHSVHYIAGPQIGYRVLKNVKGPHLPSVFPFSGPNIIPSDFYNYIDKNSNGDVFDTGRPSTGAGDVGFDNAPGASSGGRPRPRPPSRPNKPTYTDDGDDYDSDSDLFGGGTATGSAGGGGSNFGGTTGSGGNAGSTFGGGGSSTTTTSRPSSSDYDGGFNGDDEYDNTDLFGGSSSGPSSRPKPSRPTGSPSSTRPPTRPNKPNYDEDTDDENEEDLFGGGGGGSSSTRPPVISIGSTTGPGSTQGDKHTIVTNLGTTVFTVPPGVSVKAHVQSIDLFPYESKVPSPSEQYRAETTKINRKIKANLVSSTPTTTFQSTTESFLEDETEEDENN